MRSSVPLLTRRASTTIIVVLATIAALLTPLRAFAAADFEVYLDPGRLLTGYSAPAAMHAYRDGTFAGSTTVTLHEYDEATGEPAAEISGAIGNVVVFGGDPGEVTFDIVGLGDDSVGGYRLHIFANPAEEGDGFVLKSVERTTLCSRGVTGELCS